METDTVKLAHRSNGTESQSPTVGERPIVVGLYGLPGTGKTTLLGQLEHQLGTEHFSFFDGSDMIKTLVPGGLEAFKALSEEEKTTYRQQAIIEIGKQCAASGKTGIVAGHCMFWPEGQVSGDWIMTDADLATYTHIVYLDVPVNVIAQRRRDDKEKSRDHAGEAHLMIWQNEETRRLRKQCRDKSILLSILQSEAGWDDLKALLRTQRLLLDFREHTQHINLAQAEARLDEIVGGSPIETTLVIDGDRTLVAEDTGPMFFEKAAELLLAGHACGPLKALFGSPMGYSYAAFRQAMLLYEDVAYALADPDGFQQICEHVAGRITIYPEFLALLKTVAETEHVGAIIITCGLRTIWDMVLEMAGLQHKVEVIGGGRLEHGFVVTAEVKGALVSRLQKKYRSYVWAFGDSPLDLDMLRAANEATVVVGAEQGRSQTMEAKLEQAIAIRELKARQVLLPKDSSPRLDFMRLQEIELTDVARQIQFPFLLHATDKGSAKLLATATRDANIRGPALQDAHRRVGRYLATEYVTDVVGLEEYDILHVQGKSTVGHRLLHEDKTLIVALMRGGLPMAEGVNEAFPLAGFLHANVAGDLTPEHLAMQSAVVLVDSVINKGTTIKEFVEHIRSFDITVRIVVVTGVVQSQSVAKHGLLRKLARQHGGLNIVALRLSNNKYTGKGTTDTGHRLFNTTHLD